jgi:hypothetical protein
MSDLRPVGSEGDGAALLLASARARVSAAAADLALPAGLRLTDRQRTTVHAMLAQLVRSVEDELRAALLDIPGAEGLRAAFSSAHIEIALPVLSGGALFTEPALTDLLLRRAEEHRLYRSAASENLLLVELAGSSDGTVAREAMGLLIAQNGRLDGFHEPILPLGDLPAELGHHLVWTVAAALRRYMIDQHKADPAICDTALASAAGRLLARHDEGETVQARAMRLASALRNSTHDHDNGLLVRALSEGSFPLFLALLGLRAGLHPDAVWELLSTDSGPVLLLRTASVTQNESVAILLALGVGEEALAALLDRFAGLSGAAARSPLALWQADPGYRAAVARLAL